MTVVMSDLSGNPSSNVSGGSVSPLFSEFAHDADMAELVEFFTAELQSRIDQFTQAFGSNDYSAIRRLAHQMKGAAGGYGYPSISEVAGVLEQMIDGGSSESQAIENQFEALIALCRRAQAGAR